MNVVDIAGVRYAQNGMDPMDAVGLDTEHGRSTAEMDHFVELRFETGGVGGNKFMQLKEEVYRCTASK